MSQLGHYRKSQCSFDGTDDSMYRMSMTAAISAADRSLDLVISLSSWQTRYSGYLITGLAFEPRYSGTRQLIFECGITVTRSGFDFLVALQEMIWSPAGS